MWVQNSITLCGPTSWLISYPHDLYFSLNPTFKILDLGWSWERKEDICQGKEGIYGILLQTLKTHIPVLRKRDIMRKKVEDKKDIISINSDIELNFGCLKWQNSIFVTIVEFFLIISLNNVQCVLKWPRCNAQAYNYCNLKYGDVSTIGGKKPDWSVCRWSLHPVARQVDRALAFQLCHVVLLEAYSVRWFEFSWSEPKPGLDPWWSIHVVAQLSSLAVFMRILLRPWQGVYSRPAVSTTGYTEYYFGAESGKVCRYRKLHALVFSDPIKGSRASKHICS
jgi:hypothetical protein